MKLLLDTHTFLWSIGDDPRLSPVARQHIADPSNDLFISVASLWEATIKIATGKMRVPDDSVDYLLNRAAEAGTNILPILPTTFSTCKGCRCFIAILSTACSSLKPWLRSCHSSRLTLNSGDTMSRFFGEARSTVAGE